MSQEKCCRLLPMDELQYRHCEVDGVPALFHRWCEDDRALLRFDVLLRADVQERLVSDFRNEGICGRGCSVDVIRETFALVEYRDGTMHKVDPLLVRFVNKEGGHGT